MNDFERRLIESPKLPSIPGVAQRLLELLNNEETELAELADVISRDPALTAKIIRLINSPFYGISREVSSLQTAVLYLGYQSVRSVALSFSLFSAFQTDPAARKKLDILWLTSLMTGIAARRLAAETGNWEPEEAFLAGLVADCGALLLQRMTPDYGNLLDRFCSGEEDLFNLEESELETTHASLGSLLLKKWHFPESLWKLVANHHGPSDASGVGDLNTQVHTLRAAWLYTRALVVPGFANEVLSLDRLVSDSLGIPVAVARSLAQELPGELREMACYFELPADEQKSYETLMEEANEALSEYAVDADQGARALADAIARRRDDFAGLEEATATTEDVEQETGLLCRPAFERLLEAFHRRALQTQRPLGLIIVEVSDLEALQSSQGDCAWVEVLKRIAECVSKFVRRTDHLCRFDKNQIAVLAPGCRPDDLLRSALRIRSGLDKQPLITPRGSTSCDFVLGLAASDPYRDAVDAHTLIRFACAAIERAREDPDRLALNP